MLAFRLISGDSLFRARSFCPACNKTIAWYDLIPLLSWIILKGKCRQCSAAISWLYFFIEALAALSFSALFFLQNFNSIGAYFIFFSALLITIRTDTEHMLISRYTTLFLIPVGILFSFYTMLPITPLESITGAFSGYLFLYGIRALFFIITKKVGMGQGDLELIAFIGSFLGITGWWISLIIGSFLGSLFGLLALCCYKKKRSTKIPFGPFLAVGALLYVLFEESLTLFFLTR